MFITRRCWFFRRRRRSAPLFGSNIFPRWTWISPLLWRLIFRRLPCFLFLFWRNWNQAFHDIHHLLTFLHSLFVSILPFKFFFKMTLIAVISHVFENFQDFICFCSFARFSYIFSWFSIIWWFLIQAVAVNIIIWNTRSTIFIRLLWCSLFLTLSCFRGFLIS